MGSEKAAPEQIASAENAGHLAGQPTDEQTENSPGGSRLVSRLLPPAVRLWIHQQLDHVENLEFRLVGRDRQILSGHVPAVMLAAERAIYQGLHLSQVQAEAKNIRINLGQVMRGKSLHLLQRFPVTGSLMMSEPDLNASLAAPLMQQALQDFLQLLLQQTGLYASLSPPPEIAAATLRLQPSLITLELTTTAAAWILKTGLEMREGHILALSNPTLTSVGNQPQNHFPKSVASFEIDLGDEVEISFLKIAEQRLMLQGTVYVVPAE